MAINHNQIQAMRHRIQDSLGPKKRSRKRRVKKAMEQLTLADFVTSMLGHL